MTLKPLREYPLPVDKANSKLNRNWKSTIAIHGKGKRGKFGVEMNGKSDRNDRK